MQQQPPRRYQRNGQPGKGLTITLAPAMRARIEAAAATKHASLAAVIVAILNKHFGLSTETTTDEEAA